MKKSRKDMATANLLASFREASSRRSLLKGAAAGATALGVGALGAFPALAQVTRRARASADTQQLILSVSRTAEQLAVTFYSHGIANADQLGVSGDNLQYLKAALVEEQIHQQFFTANGGASIADTFSFPAGPKTFTDLTTFIATQQALEGVFDSAFLAAVAQFAELGRPDLAQISGQIACIEAEHRVLGRVIGNLMPANNWAFTPVLIGTVGEAPAVVKKAGFLSPMQGNSYTYQEVSTDFPGIEQRKPFSATPIAVGNG